MGNIAAASHGPAAETGDKLNKRIAGNKIFCFDGEEEIEKDVAVGEHHAEGKQDAVDGSGSADRWIGIADGSQKIDDCSADTASKIVDVEFPGAPLIFNFRSKHPEGEHIEEEMGTAAVQKHVGYRLPELEVFRADWPECAEFLNYSSEWSEELQKKNCNIGKNDRFDSRRHKLKAAGAVWLVGVVHQEIVFCTSRCRPAAGMSVKVVNSVNTLVVWNRSIVQGGNTRELLAFKEFEACAASG